MTNVLQSLWLAGHDACPQALSADGFPLTQYVDKPNPPAALLSATSPGCFGPDKMTVDPTLYFCKVQYRPMNRSRKDTEVDARHTYWPPPLACVSMQPTLDGSPQCRSALPTPEGVIDTPNYRSHYPMDTTGLMLFPPQRCDTDDRSQQYRDKCFYGLSIRPYRFVRFDESGATTRRANGSAPPKKVARRSRKTRHGGGVRQNSRRLAAIDKRLCAFKAQLTALREMGGPLLATSRLLQWQDGGVSFDDQELEFECGTQPGSMGPKNVPDPTGEGARRSIVFGVPARTLASTGLFPTFLNEVLDTLCHQLCLSFLPTKSTVKKQSRSSPPFSRAELRSVLFPPLDIPAWQSKVRHLACEAKIDHLRESMTTNEDHTDCCASLKDDAVYLDIQAASGKSSRKGAHTRVGWDGQIVPAFLLPFLLMQPSLYGAYESQLDPWFACLHIAHGLRLLSNAPSLTAVERAAAWHDTRLMAFSMSLVWKYRSQHNYGSCDLLQQARANRKAIKELADVVDDISTVLSQEVPDQGGETTSSDSDSDSEEGDEMES